MGLTKISERVEIKTIDDDKSSKIEKTFMHSPGGLTKSPQSAIDMGQLNLDYTVIEGAQPSGIQTGVKSGVNHAKF